ncbi:MAG: hypothetical protein F7C82_01400 [Desulfurococcales archaeon]|nr:hypothetical protein [Desulfurococcales archaeon]MCE4627023.1 hypothetical protein [Desulfurococcales archaeon]MCE4628916.1 hypothetical protein [Desulfurococcales archaeon]
MKIKREARILVSKCYCSKCIGVVLRGGDVDGAVSGHSCDELCSELKSRGFSGELRYAVGDCRCGFPPPPRASLESQSLLLTLSSSLPLWVSRSMHLLGAGDCH